MSVRTPGLVSDPAGTALRPELGLYCEAKKAAADFQSAKEQLFVSFKKAELGKWVKKPMEQDEFSLE